MFSICIDEDDDWAAGSSVGGFAPIAIVNCPALVLVLLFPFALPEEELELHAASASARAVAVAIAEYLRILIFSPGLLMISCRCADEPRWGSRE
jgi:hypothetical protein